MFLDVGIGILTTIYIGFLFKANLTVWLLVCGIIFSLLPDVDFIKYFYLKDKMEGYKHRDALHLPILYLPIGTLIVYLFLGKVLALIFFVSSFLHFIHDSMFIGRGIKWLYPFSNNGYAFLYMYSRKVKNGLWKPLFIFNEEKIRLFDSEHGDADWFKNIYLKWHPFAVLEFTVLIVSLIILFLYVR